MKFVSSISEKMARRKEPKYMRGDPLAIQLIPDDVDILPAAVRYARELLGARPNDVNVTVEHENIRAERCFIKLRFPDGEKREIRFSKSSSSLT